MKLPSKYIASLVLLSFTAILAYQAYWLVNLYKSQKSKKEQRIVEIMQFCDFSEMTMRINRFYEKGKHGEIVVATGVSKQGNFVHSSARVLKQDSNQVQLSIRMKDKDTVKNNPVNVHLKKEDNNVYILSSEKSSDVHRIPDNEGQKTLIISHEDSTGNDLFGNIQEGVRQGFDILGDTDLNVYDSLLTVYLKKENLLLPYRLETYKEESLTVGDSVVSVMVPIASKQAPDYVHSPSNRKYTSHNFCCYMPSLGGKVLSEMTGILLTSFVILLVLAFSFWYLIRVLLQQKHLDEMKSDFTNNITHELKTPIAVAYAANDALLHFDTEKDREQREKYLLICQEQLQRLSRLVEQILSMSMERRKTFALQMEEISVRKVLEQLVEQHKLKAEKPLFFTTEVNPDDLLVYADRIHFYNILSNLVDNAVKYSKEEAHIHIIATTVETDGESKVRISVADKGIGMTEEQQRYIFDKFYRVPTGNLHEVKGYGLGLFYVKTLVERHGGSVSVNSKPGKGSTFTIQL